MKQTIIELQFADDKEIDVSEISAAIEKLNAEYAIEAVYDDERRQIVKTSENFYESGSGTFRNTYAILKKDIEDITLMYAQLTKKRIEQVLGQHSVQIEDIAEINIGFRMLNNAVVSLLRMNSVNAKTIAEYIPKK